MSNRSDRFDALPALSRATDGSYAMPNPLSGFRVRTTELEPRHEGPLLASLIRSLSDDILLKCPFELQTPFVWLADLDAKVFGDTRLTVTGADGQPVADIEVKAYPPMKQPP